MTPIWTAAVISNSNGSYPFRWPPTACPFTYTWLANFTPPKRILMRMPVMPGGGVKIFRNHARS
ncbi:MAG: hypothetical protein JXR37_04765 [Kiritimatiellae bacterium]|nr:hypothetical protein [Kiritimatiellia bacterium]